MGKCCKGKRIVIAINSLATGGTQRVISVLASYLCQQENLEVHIVLFGRNPKIHFNLPECIFIHKPDTSFDNRFRHLYTIGRLVYLRRTIRRIKPYSVLSFGEYWNNLALLALIGLKTSVYVSDRSQPGKRLGIGHHLLRDILYRTASGYIAQTGYAAEYAIRRKWNRNIKVIGNPVKEIKPFSWDKGREKIVLSVGRMIATKNFDRLVKAFMEIDDKDWKLVIVGGDHGKQKIFRSMNALVKQHHAEDRVLLTDYQTNISEYYERSQIFAFMSSSEGFSNAILEALSAALPVVSFQYNPGILDLIQDGRNGFLVPLDDDEQFKQKLSLLMRDSDLRQSMAEEAVGMVREFELDKIGASLCEFLFGER